VRIEELLLDEKLKKDSFRIIDENKEWKLTELGERVLCLKSVLTGRGIKPLDNVAVICENGAAFFVAVLAVLTAGAVAVPVDPQLPLNMTVEMLKKCGVKCICISGVRPEKNFLVSKDNGMPDEFDILCESAGSWAESYTSSNPKNAGKAVIPDNSPALILFSSGTSGTPKGVVLSHSAVISNVEAIVDCFKPDDSDIFYLAKTMVHASTLIGEMLVALKVGAATIALNPVVPASTTLKRIEMLKPTFICVNPTILRLLLQAKSRDYDVSSVRVLYSCGAVAEKDLLLEAEKLFINAHVLNVYGLTEAGPRVTAQIGDNTERRPGCAGKPISGVEVIIKNNENEICKTGEIGEIYVKSPALMLGYYGDPQATDEKIKDGWLKTGDLGYFCNNGEIFIIGRADDIIVRGAHNIDPNRIESVVRKLEDIEDCIVFGVQDYIHGNKVVCAFQKKANSTISRQDIFNQCTGLLAPYEYPQEIYEWTHIPKTANGKVSRKLAVQYYNDFRIETKS